MPIVSVTAPGQQSRYDIHIGRDLLSASAPLFAAYAGRRAVIVSDENTAPLYGDTLLRQIHKAGIAASLFVLPAGETTKCLQQLERLYDAFINAGITRADLVIALGGGVIGDITGYAACTYLRGVHFIQVPTTLLAQVDSSVGGKVAINLPRGKNLLGAFYQPDMVLIDVDTLHTLDDRQIGAGLGEIIKYGCIADAALFEQLEALSSREALMPVIDTVIACCCQIKARYVAQDPHDHGVRMQLNFGHTLAHALENAMGYGSLLHGEAVCIGMIAAAKWGESLGVSPQGIALRILRLLEAYR
ncbi:MAG: 3-dehydroquinate synthase, partial [Clostridia bacterium]|nr:3-dehydroquinate synthase [Clostridia bacterium]